MSRILISSNTPWESIVGYSRAVRDGRHVFVSGTTATDDSGNVVTASDLYTQTAQAISNIEQALLQVGARMEDVVRTRLFVTDITQWREAARAHAERFEAIRPATTMIEVKRLIDPSMLIEIEADALLPEVADPISR